MQLIDGAIRATGTNVSGYSLFQVSSTAADRRRRADRRAAASSARSTAADGPKSPRARGGLRATLPALLRTRHLQPGSAGNAAARLQLPRTRIRRPRTRRPAAVTSPTRRGSSSNGPSTKGTEHLEYFIPPASRSRTWCCPSTRSGARPAARRRRSPARSRPVPARRRSTPPGELQKLPPPIDEEAEEERTKEAREEEADEDRRSRPTKTERSAGLRRDQQLRPFRCPLPTLFSFGLAGRALPSAAGPAARTSRSRPRR